jgi:choline dehydrogenase-like flavoprotein
MIGSFRASGPLDLSCQALIVGSGAGGASVADELTRAGLDVVMLEEGPYAPAGEAPPRATEAFARTWRSGGLTAAVGPSPIAYAEGRCVGGSTEINSAIFQRTPDILIDEWAKRYQIAEFSPSLLKPYFDRAGKAVNSSLTPGELGRATEIICEGAKALGWAFAPLERGQRSCMGTNMCSFVCPTAGKQSMSNSLLPDAIARGLRLIADCRATRILVRDRRVTEVRGQARDAQSRIHRVRIRADVVVLAAGAIQTPALLLRSGFGGRIGATLRLHPTLRAIAAFDRTVDAHLSRLPLAAVTEFMPDQRIGGSVFSPALFAMAITEDLANRERLLPIWRRCGLYYGMIRPRGRGRILVIPGLPEPIVTFKFDREDWTSLAVVAERLAQVMFAAGARLVVPNIVGHTGWYSPEQARCELANGLPKRRTNLMTIHLFSSCPPGEALEKTVTDSFGRMRGIENLILADASQIPEPPGVNPQGTVMALAFRAAEAVLAGSVRDRKKQALREA